MPVTGYPITGALAQLATPHKPSDRLYPHKKPKGFKSLFTFDGADGGQPFAAPISVGGTLYGTTANGGTYGKGSVYAVTASGSEAVVHSFGGPNDGEHPDAPLVEANGTLYGTTTSGRGGSCPACGTVFSITPSGTETVVYRFQGYPNDGSDPFAGLLNVGGILYGTTVTGGAFGRGTVFSITPAGVETVLHNFGTPSVPDGAEPDGGLIDVDGVLYGTTTLGGHVNNDQCLDGCGTLFQISPSGAGYSLLYEFGTDFSGGGFDPVSGLVDVNGTLYGTTFAGGSSYGGTVFAFQLLGETEYTLSNFQGAPDGAGPFGGLVNVNGVLYGTTSAGGSGPCPGSQAGCGTIFGVTPSGTETVLHSFAKDDPYPRGGLFAATGLLYGTTSGVPTSGAPGRRHADYGTVFIFNHEAL